MVLKRAVFLIFIIFLVYVSSYTQEYSTETPVTSQLKTINNCKKNLWATIDSIEQNKTIIPKDILEKAQKLYDLTTEYHETILNNIVSSQKITNNTNLVSNILLNSEDILKTNKTYKQPIDTITVCKDILNKTEICTKSLKMAQDLNMNNPESKHLFNQPINSELLCKHYDITPGTLQTLITESSGNTTPNNKVETIQKGHSPFTNTYDEFIYFADSIGKSENKDKNKVQSPNNATHTPESNTIHKNINEYNNLANDSLFGVAIEDSLFPHDLIKKYDKASLKRYWSIYKNQWNPEVMQAQTLAQITPSQQVNANLISTPTTSSSDQNIVNHKTKNRVVVSDSRKTITENNSVDSTPLHTATPDITYTKGENIKTDNIDQNPANYYSYPDTYYYIQLAASRTPIEGSLLSSLNEYNDSITVRNEEGWYKYQINKTTNYKEALTKSEQLNVKGAFIVAYQNNEKQVLWKTLHKQQNHPKDTGLIFVVQVSANKVAVNNTQLNRLKEIANGEIREREENGWFKYQYVVGPSYKDALQKWKQIGSKTSFLVAYLNNEKIEMSKAIKIYNSNKTN